MPLKTEKTHAPADKSPATPLVLFAGLGLALFLLALLGIASRPAGSLAAIWPANAFLLGLMLRCPRCRSITGWLVASAALVAADLITGSNLIKTSVLTAGNLVSVVAGVFVATRLSRGFHALEHKHGVIRLIGVALVASAAAGFAGMIANPLIFNGSIKDGWNYWLVTEFANYVAFLPVMLAAPVPAVGFRRRLPLRFRPPHWHRLLPGAAVILLCMLATLIDGPGAIAIPVIALLWCGLTYSVFATALLTLFFCIWTLMALSFGYIAFNPSMSSWANIMSLRLSISMIALVPIIVAIHSQSRVRELEALEFSANYDALTNCLNRRAFLAAIEQWLRVDPPRRLALLMIDVDHFKSINDTHGHPAGDSFLQHAVEVIQHCLRQNDLIGRLGGEEFGVMLNGCDESELETVADRIRETFAAQALALDDNTRIAGTISIGIAFALPGETDPHPLINRADQALYLSKKSGRNRVTRYEDNTGSELPA